MCQSSHRRINVTKGLNRRNIAKKDGMNGADEAKITETCLCGPLRPIRQFEVFADAIVRFDNFRDTLFTDGNLRSMVLVCSYRIPPRPEYKKR